jgi:hypothetical protein
MPRTKEGPAPRVWDFGTPVSGVLRNKLQRGPRPEPCGRILGFQNSGGYVNREKGI